MINNRTILTIAVFSAVFFLFIGGFNVLDGLTNGFSTIKGARFGVTAVFFGGFLFTGLFGLGYAVKKRANPLHSALGLGVVFFSYYSIETLFQGVIG